MDRHTRWLWNPIAPLSRRGGLPLHGGMLQRLLQWFFHPPDGAPPATLLIRLMAGGVFFWEGVMKFVFPNQGVGRFTKLGFPLPHFTATADGWFEIIGGLLLLTGLLTRLIAVPFIIEMFVAMVEEGSFHRAAARVFRTQPAVSMALRRLEQELGAPLFDRSNRSDYALTSMGEVLYDHARRLINLRDETLTALQDLHSLQSGRLRTGFRCRRRRLLLARLHHATLAPLASSSSILPFMSPAATRAIASQTLAVLTRSGKESGATVLARTPKAANSSARWQVSMWSAALDAE